MTTNTIEKMVLVRLYGKLGKLFRPGASPVGIFCTGGYPRAVHHGSWTGTMAGDQRGTWSHVHGL